MKRSPSVERELRQFTLLSRDSVRRLLDHAAASRDADPMLFAIWGTALAMTPPLVVAVRKILDYPFLLKAPPEMVERVAAADRTFFVLYGMLATALLASLIWDALFPNKTDQEILGVLPVRPPTLAAARLRGAVTVSMAFALAVNLPAALLYSLVSSIHPLLGSFPRVLFAHLLSTTAACAFTFFALMSLRGLIAISAGERIADRLALLLQLVRVVLLVEVFLFLPTVLPDLVRELQNSQSRTWLAPLWFSGLYSWVAEGHGIFALHAWTGLAATLLAAALVLLLSLPPAGWMGRRALEIPSREHGSRLTGMARRIGSLYVSAPAIGAMLVFAVASLTRSRRHLLMLSTYLGLAIGAGILRLAGSALHGRLIFDRPTSYSLALPLVFVFFAVFGLRACFSVPTDLDANWPFRMRQPTVAASSRVSRLLILTLGIVPIAVAELIAGLILWTPATAAGASLYTLVSGIALTDVALMNWTRVPFASAHEPSIDSMKSRWPAYLFALFLFAFVQAALKLTVIASTGALAMALVIGLIIITIVGASTTHALRQRPLTLDVPSDGAQTLNLSEALN